MDDTIVNPFDIVLPNYEDEGTLKPTIDRAVHEDAEPPTSNFFEEAMRDTMSSYETFIVPYNTITASEEDTTSKYDPISNLLGSRTRSEGETLTTKTSTGPQGTLIDQDASVPVTSPPTRSNLDVVETPGAFNGNSNNEDAPDTDPPNVSTRSDTSTLETPTSSPLAASSDISASIGATRSSFSSDADCCNGPPNIGSQPPYISTSRLKSGTERDDESTVFVPKEKHTSSVVDKSKRNPRGPTSSIEVPAEQNKKAKASQAKLPNRTRLPHWNPLQAHESQSYNPQESLDLEATNHKLLEVQQMQQFYLTRPQSFPYPYHPYGNWPQDPTNAYPILMAAQNHYQPQRLFMGVMIAEKGTDKPITEVRVENQFRTIVALRQFPPSIKRIRLQPNNLAPVYKYKKEELLEAERIKIEASPDMLDLFAAVVRTSCVETPEGRARAFREAAANFNYNGKPNVPEEKQETDTGLMAQNCPSCCGREEKRVRRKHGWTDEHKRSYIEAAANRVICFEYKANQEHFELYGANGSSVADGKSQLTKKPSFATVGPDGTIQLDFETRIYCYSRHVSKASPSSNVLLTLKDYRGNVVAQTISRPLVITDQKARPSDHETSTSGQATPSNLSLAGYTVFPTQPAPGRPIKHAHAQSAPDFGRLNLRDNASTTQVSPISPSYSQAPGTMTPETQSRPPSPSFEQNSWNKRRRMHASASSLHHRGNSSLSRLPLQRYNTNLPGPAPSFIPPVNGFPNNYPLNAQQDMHPLYSPQFASGPCTQQPSFGNLSQYATTINNVQHFYPQQQSPATAPLFDFASNPTSVQPSAPASSSSSSDQSRQAIGQNSDRLNVQTAATGNQSFTPTNPPPISDIAPRILVCEPGQGEVTGGLMVNIRGQGFIPGVQVLFDGIAATETICHDQSRLICTVPPAAKAGPVAVSCNLPGAHSDAMFTYIDSTDRDEVMLALGTLEAKSQGLQGRAALDLANQRLHKEKDYAGFRFGNGASPTDGSLESSLMHVLDLIDMDDSPHVADFDLQGSNGHALLHFGAFKGQYRFIAGLLARSANPNIRDLNGMTPMHLAVMQKQPKVVRKLRASGADPGLRSLAGYLPVDMAPDKEMLKLFDVLETELPSSVCPTPLSLSRRGSTGSQRPSRDLYLWDRPGANLYNSEDEDDADGYSTDRTESLCIPAVAPKITSRRSSFKLQDDSKETETVTQEKLLSSTDTAQMIQRMQRTWQSFQEAVHNFEGLGFTAQFQNMQAAVQGWPLPVPAFHSPFRPMSPNLQANEMIRRWSPFAQQYWSSEATDMDDKTKDTVPAKKTEAWGNFLDRIPSLGLSPPSYDEACPGGSKQQPTSLDVKKESEKQAQVDAMFNNAAEARFGSPNTTVVQTKATPSPKTITPRVRNDKRFLFWWLPLLFTLAYFLLGSPLSALPTIVEPVVSFARDLVPARIVGDL